MSLSPLEHLALMPADERDAALERYVRDDRAAEALKYDWEFHARPKQRTPEGDWAGWLILSGRGWGKSRTGSEWVRLKARTEERGILIGRTAADVRDVMIEGESGILACCSDAERPNYNPSRRRISWPNGGVTMCYSADEPDQLRGPQSAYLWADELAAWSRAEAAWNNAMFGHRLGPSPQWLVTTTPRPLDLLRKLRDREDVVVTVGSSYENQANLPARYREILGQYEGTRIAAQEIHGQILDSIPGALWTREMFRLAPRPLPDARRIVVAIDPSGSDGKSGTADEVGIVVAAETIDGRGVILEDLSCRLSADGWADVAVRAYHRWQADEIIGEKNFGGDLVRAVLHHADPNVPVTLVTASRGKSERAMPVALLYERGLIDHARPFDLLEQQFCMFDSRGYQGTGSPDRADAAVWALWRLFIDQREQRYVGTLEPEAPLISIV